jgi:D-serine deaminase-like pyridoxal phosphate-dependent protein
VPIEPGLSVDQLPTPCAIVDVDRLERNITRWQRAVADSGISFRPHVKTHKTAEIARMQLAAGASGIAVSKVAEAEVFAAEGHLDIVIAYPVVGRDRCARAAALARSGVQLSINVDSEVGVRDLSEAAASAGVTLGVQMDLDTGLHRGGLRADDLASIVELSRLIASLPGLDLQGITTFRGPTFDGSDGLSPAQAGADEGRVMVDTAKQLLDRGVDVRAVTAGSTPTGLHVAQVEGVTEVRAGTYVFNDLMQIGWGSATEDDVALTILTTVVSLPGRDRATVDAGSKTLAADGAAEGILARSIDGALAVDRAFEEHGLCRVTDGPSPKIGDRVALVPYHVCVCVNLSDELVAVRGGRVVGMWPVIARGKRT